MEPVSIFWGPWHGIFMAFILATWKLGLPFKMLHRGECILNRACHRLRSVRMLVLHQEKVLAPTLIMHACIRHEFGSVYRSGLKSVLVDLLAWLRTYLDMELQSKSCLDAEGLSTWAAASGSKICPPIPVLTLAGLAFLSGFSSLNPNLGILQSFSAPGTSEHICACWNTVQGHFTSGKAVPGR